MPIATIQQELRFEDGTYSLKVFKDGAGVTVILSELAYNAGPSITNAFERIATQVYHRFLLGTPVEDIIWLEHYNKQSYSDSQGDPATIDQVTLSGILKLNASITHNGDRALQATMCCLADRTML